MNIIDIIQELEKYDHTLPMSFSKATTLLACPRLYRQRYILKSTGSEAPQNEVMVVGKFVHKVLELCLNKGQSFGWEPDAIDFDKTWMQVSKQVGLSLEEYTLAQEIRLHTEATFERLLTAIKKYDWRITPELMFCMDRKGRVKPAVKWKGRFFYGFVDFYAENPKGTRAVVLDYKSHSQADDDTAKTDTQLKTYAYYLFLKNPALQSIQLGGAYLPDEKLDLSAQIFRDSPEHEEACETVHSMLEQVIDCLLKDVFTPVKSRLCAWCAYTEGCPAL